MRYEVLAGDHTDENGRKYVKGDVVETGVELDRLFVNKFRRVPEDGRDSSPTPALATPAKGDGVNPAGERTAGQRPPGAAPDEDSRTDDEGGQLRPQASQGGQEIVELGDDVTDQFDGAAKADLRVFKGGRKYHVVDASKPSVPINDEEFTRKDQVNEFIDGYGE